MSIEASGPSVGHKISGYWYDLREGQWPTTTTPVEPPVEPPSHPPVEPPSHPPVEPPVEPPSGDWLVAPETPIIKPASKIVIPGDAGEDEAWGALKKALATSDVHVELHRHVEVQDPYLSMHGRNVILECVGNGGVGGGSTSGVIRVRMDANEIEFRNLRIDGHNHGEGVYLYPRATGARFVFNGGLIENCRNGLTVASAAGPNCNVWVNGTGFNNNAHGGEKYHHSYIKHKEALVWWSGVIFGRLVSDSNCVRMKGAAAFDGCTFDPRGGSRLAKLVDCSPDTWELVVRNSTLIVPKVASAGQAITPPRAPNGRTLLDSCNIHTALDPNAKKNVVLNATDDAQRASVARSVIRNTKAYGFNAWSHVEVGTIEGSDFLPAVGLPA